MQTLMLINSQNYTYMRFRALPNVVSEIMIRPELGQYFFAHIFCSFLFNNVTFFMDLELLVGLETYIYLLFYRLHCTFSIFFQFLLIYLSMSVWLRNFKDGGSKNQHAQRNFFKTILQWIMISQKVPKLYFQSQYSMSKINGIYLNFVFQDINLGEE